MCPSELSSTTSSFNDVSEGQGQTTRTDDLDIAHIEELRDLEVRLTEKHSQDLCDLENRYKVRIQEIQDHHQVMTKPHPLCKLKWVYSIPSPSHCTIKNFELVDLTIWTILLIFLNPGVLDGRGGGWDSSLYLWCAKFMEIVWPFSPILLAVIELYDRTEWLMAILTM